MNHLAHLFLAREGTESLFGQLAGDFVKGPRGDRLTPGHRAGIQHQRPLAAVTHSQPSGA
ncbi:MAG: ACP phosphodiesterase, partial [Thermoanaerobaculia bacterium]